MAMKYEHLNSDRVNYMIWRYLQEAGFPQAAAWIQQEWSPQRHPDKLPFAKHVQPRALIHVLQWGLKLHYLQNEDRPNAPRIFGPEPVSTEGGLNTTTTIRTKSSSPMRRLDPNQPLSATTSRTSRYRKPNGSTTTTTPISTTSAKAPRSNAATNSGTTGIIGESMDVDHHQSATATRTTFEHDMEIDEDDTNNEKDVERRLSTIGATSPIIRNGDQTTGDNGATTSAAGAGGLSHRIHHPDQELQQQQQIPSPIPEPTLTNGVSISIQTEKVIDTSPKTTVINTSSIQNRILSHAEWSVSSSSGPPNSALFAVGGKQLGQIWEISKIEDSKSGEIQATTDSATEDQTSLSRILNPDKVIELETQDGECTLLSLAWSPGGDRLAYSTFSENAIESQRSVIKTRLRSGSYSDNFSTVSDAVTDLVWNSTGRYIAGLSNTSVLIGDTKNGIQLPPLQINHDLYDIAWLDQKTLVVCGHSCITIAGVSDGNLEIIRGFEDVAGTTEWTKLRHDEHSNSIAIVSDATGDLAVIQAAGSAYREYSVDEIGIVDVCWQPPRGEDQSRVLVTAFMDGSIKLWDTRSGINLIQTLHMNGINPALRLSFDSTGSMLAVADCEKVLVWDIEAGAEPKYRWETQRIDWHQSNENLTNGVNGHDSAIDMEEVIEDAPILIWNDAGLTFAYKDKVAMIRLPE